MGVLLGTRAGCTDAAISPLKTCLEAIHFCFHLPSRVIAAQHALPMQPVEAPTLFGC